MVLEESDQELGQQAPSLWFSMEGTLMDEFRVTIAIADLGRRDVAEENLDRVVDAFQRTHPHIGAVGGANFVSETLEVTFSLDSENLPTVAEAAMVVLRMGLAEAGLEMTEIVHIEIDRVDERELAPV